MLELIYKIIACHIVGDFLFQNTFLANTKGENWYHLFAHCVLYSLPFYFCFGFGWQLAVVSVLQSLYWCCYLYFSNNIPDQ